jgi:microcystin-dependent protein
MKTKNMIIMVSLLMLWCAAISFAEPIVKPNTFQDGQKALASEVNTNFDVVYDKVNSLDAEVLKQPASPATGSLLTYDGNHWIAQQPAVQHFTLSNMQPFLAINFCIALVGLYPTRDSGDPILGELMMFCGNFAPAGWAFCDGQMIAISQNQALFSILGITYGGDGRTTFALPDLRGRVPIHAGTGTGLTVRQLGESSGSESITR